MPRNLVALIDGTGNQPADAKSTDPETDVTNVYRLSEVPANEIASVRRQVETIVKLCRTTQ